MNLFYKIHLQAFNVISIVLYHSGPTFGQVSYCCQDAFVVDESDYWGHLITHLLNASEAFPTEWFLQFWEQVKGWWAHVRLYCGWGSTCHPYFSKIFDIAPEAWGRALMYDRWSLREIWLQSVCSSISSLRFAEQRPRSLANTHTEFFIEVWLASMRKIGTISSSYWPRKRSVQNFWNDPFIYQSARRHNQKY